MTDTISVMDEALLGNRFAKAVTAHALVTQRHLAMAEVFKVAPSLAEDYEWDDAEDFAGLMGDCDEEGESVSVAVVYVDPVDLQAYAEAQQVRGFFG